MPFIYSSIVVLVPKISMQVMLNIFFNLYASCHFTTCVHDLMTRVVVLEINKAESLPVNGYTY